MPLRNSELNIKKRSIVIDGHKTSVSIEDEFWDGLKEIAEVRKMSVGGVISEIDRVRLVGNLSSAIRVFVLLYFKESGGGERSNEAF
ncbi:MAG: ribbon-helix-helix domain-containing protein [Pseudolabrys sp.]|nr:ribbon-helix-helix domain-containing protein [Pseudolabrys sp.]